jgi:alpha-mannosidase
MRPGCVTVLFPCHTLDDFPTWLEEPEADGLLAAWTAAWHPAVVAATGGPPGWASVDLPPPGDIAAGVVPGFCDDRFVAQSDPDHARRWVRQLASCVEITAALAAAVGVSGSEGGPLPASGWAEDFRALGLATLLAELLARRMRTEADLAATGFEAAVLAAARAAVAGDDPATQAGLAEAFACLEATRSRYYSVESWAVDIVLIAPTSGEAAVLAELESPVPLALVAEGSTVRRLAEKHPAAVAAIRDAVAAGRAEACGGRDDSRPLELCPPEEIAASLTAGRQAWIDHLGAAPTCYAASAGGSSAILPQLLAGFGFRAAIWSLFDGSPLPDPGGGLIRWQGTGGGSIEAVARPPLDAGRSTTILELPDRIGDALDHDHSAVVAFAHYAGGASPWHQLLRRIGRWCGLVGRFVTPAELVGATAGSGTDASFEPDAFAAAAPATAGHDPVAVVASAMHHEAAALVAAARDGLAGLLAPARGGGRPTAAPATVSARSPRWLPAGWLGRRRDDDTLLLDNGLVQLRPHPRTGGLLSLRRPADRANRLSQQLALRTTQPSNPSRWEPPEDRAEHTRMEADTITRAGSATTGGIESRGRLVDAAGRVRGRFTQRMQLVEGLPLATLELEVRLEEPVTGPLFEAHVASRFAWHENEDVEVRRSLHLQSIVTERTRFTAPHFVELVPEASRAGGAVAILTGGLPWHLRSSPHVLDTILLGGGREVTCRLAVGIGLERPWDMALELAAGGLPTAGLAVPANVRLTIDPPAVGSPPRLPDQPTMLRAGLVESAGRAGEVRIEWARQVLRAAAVDLLGVPRPDVAVTVAGRTTAVRLERYQWLGLAVEFPPPASDTAGGAT